ncbi:uncharacterized protein LOC131251650 isoform X2 [Magnolia sinica]|nr:uncharacterized protein LOC131251650 isoform X2 [Magnolia sinica]XP_058108490.1 uncharacterized protein LOC131251650 isoform X2 [Magnolia sinica]
MAHLGDGFSEGTLTIPEQVASLVMVFDMSDLSSFAVIQDWVAGIDIQKFEILLCIGNKADLLPGHIAHTEYRRRLHKCGESSSDPHPEYLDYGILETEGSSLLGDEESSWEMRRSCLEWCSQHNIEYIEACASNADFDKCLSVDGDSQGVERLYGALSAHMWPGMILKSGNGISRPFPVAKDASASNLSDDEESDYEIEYELLSRGSAEPWDGIDEWVAFNDLPQPINTEAGPSINGNVPIQGQDQNHEAGDVAEAQTPNSKVLAQEETQTKATKALVQEDYERKASEAPLQEEAETKATKVLVQEGSKGKSAEVSLQEESETKALEASLQVESKMEITKDCELGEDMHLGLEDLEQLMCEISSMRENLRLMPDFQRREMAAKLAMKMATMFADSDNEGFN